MHEAIEVLKALKRAGCPMSTRLTREVITALKQGRSVPHTIKAFAAKYGRQAA
jgi:hypothetical protein